MEKIEVVGTKKVNFKDDSGRVVDGLSVFYLMDDDNTVGKMAAKLFISAARLDTLNHIPAVGEKCTVNYDRYGRPVEFTVIK